VVIIIVISRIVVVPYSSKKKNQTQVNRFLPSDFGNLKDITEQVPKGTRY